MDKQKIEFFSTLSALEKIHDDYKEVFKKIGLNVEGKDTLEVLTYLANQIIDMQLRLYDLERK